MIPFTYYYSLIIIIHFSFIYSRPLLCFSINKTPSLSLSLFQFLSPINAKLCVSFYQRLRLLVLCRLIEQLGMLLATNAHNFHNQQVSEGEPKAQAGLNVFLSNEQNESRPCRFFLLSVFLCASITFFIISHIVKFIGFDGWQFSSASSPVQSSPA